MHCQFVIPVIRSRGSLPSTGPNDHCSVKENYVLWGFIKPDSTTVVGITNVGLNLQPPENRILMIGRVYTKGHHQPHGRHSIFLRSRLFCVWDMEEYVPFDVSMGTFAQDLTRFIRTSSLDSRESRLIPIFAVCWLLRFWEGWSPLIVEHTRPLPSFFLQVQNSVSFLEAYSWWGHLYLLPVIPLSKQIFNLMMPVLGNPNAYRIMMQAP